MRKIEAMSICCDGAVTQVTGCCEGAHAEATSKRAGQFFAIAGWLLPGTMYALLPKCPACIAAYAAAATGLGISISTASYLRATILLMCAGLVLTMSLVHFRRVLRQVLGSALSE